MKNLNFISSFLIIFLFASCATLHDAGEQFKQEFQEIGKEIKSLKTTSNADLQKRDNSWASVGVDVSNRNLINLGTITNSTQQKLLLRFIREKNVAGMESALEAGANINYGETVEDINEPFYAAIYYNCQACVDFLLPKLKDKNAYNENDFNKSALFQMCGTGKIEKCRKCVEQWGLDVNKGNPLMVDRIWAGVYSNLLHDQKIYLLEKGLDFKYYDRRFRFGAEPPQVIEAMLQNSYSPFVNSKKSKESFLYRCDKENSNALRVTKAFVKAGMNVNTGCSKCLYSAVYSDDVDLVKFLLSNGINVNPQDACKTGYGVTSPLQLAVDKNKSIEIINALISNGAK